MVGERVTESTTSTSQPQNKAGGFSQHVANHSTSTGLLGRTRLSYGDNFARLEQLAHDLADGKLLRETATELAEDLRQTRGFSAYVVATRLAEFLLAASEADVAFVRSWAGGDILELASEPVWAGKPSGVVPARKHRGDGLVDLEHTSGGDRLPEHNRVAEARGLYAPGELEFLRWLRSEAWIPIRVNGVTRAVVCLGKAQPGHFTGRIPDLRQYEGFASAFYHLAELTEDKFAKTARLRHVAAVLVQIATAPHFEGFWRAVCTLLTCEHGFRFDRAMLFWLTNRGYPAECRMAIGGTGAAWVATREGIEPYFADLADYVHEAIQHPVPGQGRCPIPDPLYEEVRGHRLAFEESDPGLIRSVLANHFSEGAAIKLLETDPWVARVKRERPGVFCATNGEYFLFPLAPLGERGGRELLGFVIADLAYQPRPHAPGPDAPDLVMVALTLNLLAGMWASREDADSYLYLLRALPILRHGGSLLSQRVKDLETALQDNHPEKIQAALAEVISVTRRFEMAAEIVDRTRSPEALLPDLGAALEAHRHVLEGRYAGFVQCILGELEYAGAAYVSPHFLQSILDCLADNAVCSARDAGRHAVHLTLGSRVVQVPENKEKVGNRVLVLVNNDGPPIPAGLAPFLFVDRVSTHVHGGAHRGTGLSTARLQAKAYGGDVILRSADPVSFAVVLPMIALEKGRGDDHD